MMSVILAIWILRGSPRDATTLGGNENNFGSFFQQIVVDKGSGNPQRTDSANINLFHLFLVVHSAQIFYGLIEISSIVD
jgi:hypothetical protein